MIPGRATRRVVPIIFLAVSLFAMLRGATTAEIPAAGMFIESGTRDLTVRSEPGYVLVTVIGLGDGPVAVSGGRPVDVDGAKLPEGVVMSVCRCEAGVPMGVAVQSGAKAWVRASTSYPEPPDASQTLLELARCVRDVHASTSLTDSERDRARAIGGGLVPMHGSVLANEVEEFGEALLETFPLAEMAEQRADLRVIQLMLTKKYASSEDALRLFDESIRGELAAYPKSKQGSVLSAAADSARKARPDRALEFAQQALQITKEVGSINAIAVRSITTSDLLQANGALNQALVVLCEALALSPISRLRYDLAIQVGALEHRMRHYDASATWYRLAEEVERCPPSLWAEARALRGHAIMTTGDYVAAEVMLRQGLDMTEGRQDLTEQYAMLLVNHASVLLRVRDTGRAIRELDQAIDRLSDLPPNANINKYLAQARLDSCFALYIKGNNTEARSSLEEVLRLYSDPDHTDIAAQASFYVARLDADAGDYDSAIATYREALGIVASKQPANRLLEGLIRFAIADAQLERGDLALARAEATTSFEAFDNDPDNRVYPALLLARIALEEHDTDGADSWVQKAEESIDRDHAKRLNPEWGAGLRSSYDGYTRVVTDLAIEKLRQGPLDQETLWAQYRRLLSWKGRLVASGIRDNAGRDVPEPHQVRELLQRLPDDCVLIDYFLGTDQVKAFVYHAGELRLVGLADYDTVETAARSLRLEMTDALWKISAEHMAHFGGQLYDSLLRPILTELPSVSQVVIVPDRELASVPFHALVSAAINNPQQYADLRYVQDDYRVYYNPSTPILCDLLTRERPDVTESVALIGAPPRDDASGLGYWAELPKVSRRMGDSLVKRGQWSKSLADELDLALDLDLPDVDFNRSALRVALGTAATPAALRTLSKASLIHIGCHGEGTDGEFRLELHETSYPSGWVTSRDLAEWQLQAGLVVLAACDSASGDPIPGEGVLSLSHGFLRSGSNAVISTMWPILDDAAGHVMVDFYDRLLKADPTQPDVALTETVAALRVSDEVFQTHEAGDPYVWAPYIYVGAPRAKD